MSLKTKFNPLVKKGFDLYNDIASWVNDNFAKKEHTHSNLDFYNNKVIVYINNDLLV